MACDCTANASAPAVRRAGWPVDPRVSPVPRTFDPRVTRQGLWDGTRAATYVFPSTRPERVVEPTEPPGPLPWTVSRDPTPFGATFTELRNLNPPTSSDLYPWIRDLLTPGLSTTAFSSARPAWLALFTAAGGGSTDADGLGVSDWGLPFEEIDP